MFGHTNKKVEDGAVVKIIESGTNNGWKYKKYSDGEIRATYSASKTIACDGNMGSSSTLKRSDAVPFPLPSGLFTSIDNYTLSVTRDGTACLNAISTGDTSVSGYAIVISNTGFSSARFDFSWELIGN